MTGSALRYYFMTLKKLLHIILCSLFIISCSQDTRIIHDSAGHVIPLSELKGKWVILNEWADWCESCMSEVPSLNYFFQNNTHKNIILFGMNYDKLSNDELQLAIKKMQIIYPVLLEDPHQFWNLDDTDVLPTTYIINPTGHLAQKIIGSITAQRLLAIIIQLQKNPNENK
jgi:thiol-disulfide isomerase/thioredoxin